MAGEERFARGPESSRALAWLPAISAISGALSPYLAGLAARAWLLRKGARVIDVASGALQLLQVSLALLVIFLLLGLAGASWSVAANAAVRRRTFACYGALASASLASLWFCFSVLSETPTGPYSSLDVLRLALFLAPHYVLGGLLVALAAGGLAGWLLHAAAQAYGRRRR